MEYYSAIKNKEIPPFDSMNGPGEYYAREISQSKNNKYHDFTYMWNLMNKLN